MTRRDLPPRADAAPSRDGRAPGSLLVVAAVLVLNVRPAQGAEGSLEALDVQVEAPSRIAFAATGLGVATHSIRVILTNGAAHKLVVPAHDLRFDVLREGSRHACEPPAQAARWPVALGAGERAELDVRVTCETPLPGSYEIEVRAVPRGGGPGVSHVLGTFPLTVEPGPYPPVRLPWSAGVYASATASRDARPSAGAASTVRLSVAYVNGSAKPLDLPPAQLSVKVTGPRDASCERTLQVPAAPRLEPSRSSVHTFPVACDFRREGVYEVSAFAVGGADEQILLSKVRVRIRDLPTPLPPPAGGMYGWPR